MDDFEDAVEEYNRALIDFMKGDPEPVRQMFSERDDVLLCNPIHPFAKGPQEIAETTRRASSLFTDGDCECGRVISFVSGDLAYVVQTERWHATVDSEPRSGELRVTMIFRKEDSGWKVSHRHADPMPGGQAAVKHLLGDT